MRYKVPKEKVFDMNDPNVQPEEYYYMVSLYRDKLQEKFDEHGIKVSIAYEPAFFIWLASFKHVHKTDNQYRQDFDFDCKCPILHFKTEADYAYFLLIKDELI